MDLADSVSQGFSGVLRSLLQDDGDSIVGWEGWVTLAILVVGLVILFKDWIKTEFVMMGMLLALIVTKVIDVKTALEGFASSSILTVMILFGVAEGISQTGALDAFFQKVLGRPTNCSAAIVRMCLPVCFWSSFLNNTPVVALMIPILVTWSRVIKLPVSKFMIPLSYVSELGGVCTLIGTSTNLVVKEKYDQAVAKDPSLPDLQIFSQSRFGIPIALMGVVYIALFGHYILPGSSHVGGVKKKKLPKDEEEEPIQVGMIVPATSPAVGRTVADVGLADMADLKLTRIDRDGVSLPVYDLASRVINVYDELYVSGDMTLVDELAAQLDLVIVTDEYDHNPFTAAASRAVDDSIGSNSTSAERNLLLRKSAPVLPTPPELRTSMPDGRPSDGSVASVRMARLVHVTIKEGAPIEGMTIKQARFRTRFNAAVVDVRRHFKRVPGTIADSVLKAGDELLLDVGMTFDSASADSAANFEQIRHIKAPAKQFMMALEVPHDSPLMGKTLQEAGLRGMGNAFVSTIQRGEKQLHAVSPHVQLEGGDVLWIAGSSEAVSNLRNKKGLRPYGPQASTVAMHHRELIQAALSSASPLIGTLVSEANFEQYNVSLLAVHRSGERLTSLKGVRFQTGDGLLLEGSREFVKEHAHDEGFVLLSVLENSSRTKWNRSLLALFLLVALIVAQVAQNVAMDKPWIDFLPLCALTCALMLLTRCMTPAQLHKALKWDVYLTIASAIGISNALEDSGVAKMIADGIVSVGKAMGGDIFIIAAMYITTALLSNIIANNAAAALLFPIMLNISKSKGIKLEYLAYTLMFGASSAFMTPYGYQTNLMVQDVGGYASIDFLKFGGPLQVWQAIVTIAIMAVPDHWYLSWIVVAIICAVVFVPALASDTAVYRKLKHHALGFGKKNDDAELQGVEHTPAPSNV